MLDSNFSTPFALFSEDLLEIPYLFECIDRTYEFLIARNNIEKTIMTCLEPSMVSIGDNK